MLPYLCYATVLSILSVYSYFLVDPNLTLVNHPLWESFRNFTVYWGYYQRGWSVALYLALVLLLYLFHRYFVRNAKNVNLRYLLVILGGVGLLSYPFLSHDFFNYMFDAKIFTFYGQNPYLKSALDFPADQWVRFMHWTHRTYPYGPVFLLLSFLPSALSFGKFLISYLLFKVLFLVLVLSGLFLVGKKYKKEVVYIGTQPLFILEGLVNMHNDLVALGLVLLGVAFLLKKRKWFQNVFIFALASLIKYTNFPVLLLSFGRRKLIVGLALVGQLALIAYFAFYQVLQPWYFLNLLPFAIFFLSSFEDWDIFFLGLLFSYYPYIFLGGWDKPEKVNMKMQIIAASLILNLLYLGIKRLGSLKEGVVLSSKGQI
jgi:hypothetical protein